MIRDVLEHQRNIMSKSETTRSDVYIKAGSVNTAYKNDLEHKRLLSL